MTFLPSNKFIIAALGPCFSEPAIGWDPMNWLDFSLRAFFASFITFDFVLPTSVITVFSFK